MGLIKMQRQIYDLFGIGYLTIFHKIVASIAGTIYEGASPAIIRTFHAHHSG
jgi:hypothetical protein